MLKRSRVPVRIDLDRIGFWPDNRGGMGLISRHSHHIAPDRDIQFSLRCHFYRGAWKWLHCHMVRSLVDTLVQFATAI